MHWRHNLGSWSRLLCMAEAAAAAANLRWRGPRHLWGNWVGGWQSMGFDNTRAEEIHLCCGQQAEQRRRHIWPAAWNRTESQGLPDPAALCFFKLVPIFCKWRKASSAISEGADIRDSVPLILSLESWRCADAGAAGAPSSFFLSTLIGPDWETESHGGMLSPASVWGREPWIPLVRFAFGKWFWMPSKAPFLSPSGLSIPSPMVAFLPLSPSVGWQAGDAGSQADKEPDPNPPPGLPTEIEHLGANGQGQSINGGTGSPSLPGPDGCSAERSQPCVWEGRTPEEELDSSEPGSQGTWMFVFLQFEWAWS